MDLPATYQLKRYLAGMPHWARVTVVARRERCAVTVTKVVNAPVDTVPGDVKLAAALACRDALGLELDDPPRLEPSGAVFP